MGEDAAGSVFPDNARQVTAWRFDGYSPERVLGVRFGDDQFAVFVADSVGPEESERIRRELSRTRR